jgi:RHH-type proline utilization regulon transcriptional repressor/proline dehydrogenase/delta 1-pyrroline-5-carboxylate dehydrogenase
MKRSAFGGGIKAGGPNYVACFTEVEETNLKPNRSPRPVRFETAQNDLDRLNAAASSYKKAYEDVFSKAEDVSNIYGEENVFRYLPMRSIGFRIEDKDALTDVLMVVTAAETVKSPLTISISADDPKLAEIEKSCSIGSVTIVKQTTDEFVNDMDKYERIRTCSSELPDYFYAKAAELGKHIASAKPLTEGRIELLNYLKEQSIAFEYHRYGSIFGENGDCHQ